MSEIARLLKFAPALALVVALMPLTSVAAPQGGDRDLVITNAVVIDGTGGSPIEGATLVVRDGKIDSITPGGSVPADARVIDLDGRYLMPGLIDAHVHISNTAQARAALISGVTTARSMGVSNFADTGLRALSKSGHLDGPEILATGYHVRPTWMRTSF